MSSIALPSDDSISSLSTLKTEAPFPRPISTGPRSPEGKSRSSQNARKHNLSSSTPPPSLLANSTYQLSLEEFKEEFNPITPAQSILVKELNFISWKLAQIPHLERQLQATPIGQPEPTPLDPKPTPQDYTPANDPTNEITATHLLQNQPTPLTRLWDHHRRLLAHFQSVVRQIHTLQKQEEQKAQNEAQGESDRERSRRIAKEQSAFDEITHQMHQKLKQKQEEARHQREEEYNREWITPSPGTPGEGRGGRGEGPLSTTNPAPRDQPAPKSLDFDELSRVPSSRINPSIPEIAPAQNELPHSQIATRKSPSSS